MGGARRLHRARAALPAGRATHARRGAPAQAGRRVLGALRVLAPWLAVTDRGGADRRLGGQPDRAHGPWRGDSAHARTAPLDPRGLRLDAALPGLPADLGQALGAVAPLRAFSAGA